jgi:hypothetical protein
MADKTAAPEKSQFRWFCRTTLHNAHLLMKQASNNYIETTTLLLTRSRSNPNKTYQVLKDPGA